MSDSKKVDFLRTSLTLFNSGTIPIPAKLTQRLITPIIYNPEDYVMYIERFTSNTNFPLFFPVSSDGTFVTDYVITIQYGIGAGATRYDVQIPVNPYDTTNGIFNISTFLNAVNRTALLAFTVFNTAHPSAPPQSPPYFYFDSATQLISLYLDVGWQVTVAEPVFL
jgi:hypothetical protein